jgi:hypothetical protein
LSNHGTTRNRRNAIKIAKHQIPSDMLSRIRILAMRFFEPRNTPALPRFAVSEPLRAFDAIR